MIRRGWKARMRFSVIPFSVEKMGESINRFDSCRGWQTVSPSPGGEGRGEGERWPLSLFVSQSHSIENSADGFFILKFIVGEKFDLHAFRPR